jgi:alpha-mannosidase
MLPTDETTSASAPRAQLRCHVISNTHWDREWRYPFQSYRMDLVVMMDRLLDILERQPGYRAFFLDSQTCLLEDYLEIRPGNERRIKAQVKADRLQIGPWYTLPDMWGCPGEALVRNLLMGHKTARRFGRVTKVGYTPFSNGQISQVPQLYQGFGLDSIMFYRGIGKHVARSEFVWEGPDGSRVFGFRFGDYARYNYYYLLYRPGLLGRTIRDRDYVWDPEEVPYRVANEQTQDRQYGTIAQKLSVHGDLLRASLDDGVSFTRADATTSQLLYMMGHDHSFAAAEELDLIAALQREAGADGEQVIHSSLTDYMEAFRAEAKDLEVVRGEMRHTLKTGLWTTLMARILSCRLYLKQENARVNAKVLCGAEPLAAAAWIAGNEYPARYLELAWQRILLNQAHDAIGGCSVDKVHREMQARWSEVDTIADETCRRSMRDIAAGIDGSWIAPRDLQLTVFNPMPYERGGIAEFLIDVPTADEGAGFTVERRDGTAVPVQVVSRQAYDPTMEGGFELNMPFVVQRFRAKLDLPALPGMGWEALAVRPTAAPALVGAGILQGTALENAQLRAEVNPNGTLRVTDRSTGRVMDNLCWFEDTAEFGDPWNRVTPEADAPFTSLAAAAKVEPLHGGPLEGALRVSLEFQIPAGMTPDKKARTADKVTLPVLLTVVLKKDSPVLEVTAELDNRAENHRLRIMLPSGIAAAENSYAEGQFDVLERAIRLPDATGWKEPPYATHPMWSFCGASDGANGLAVLNDGLTEYEVVDDADRTIAVTLLRTFGTFVFGRPTPDSQCPGRHTYRFGIHPHRGGWADSRVVELAREFISPLQALESAPTKGAGAHRRGMFSVSDPRIAFAAVKQGEDGKGLVLRVWNPFDREIKCTLHCGVPVRRAALLTLEEKREKSLRVKDNRIRLVAGPKKIVTIGMQIAG